LETREPKKTPSLLWIPKLEWKSKQKRLGPTTFTWFKAHHNKRKKPEKAKHHKKIRTKLSQAAPNRINPKSSLSLNRPSTTIENKHPQKINHQLKVKNTQSIKIENYRKPKNLNTT